MNTTTSTSSASMFERLRSVPIFDGFSDGDLQHLAENVKERHLEEAEVLFYQGDEGLDTFVILDGALEVITYVDGEEIRLEVRLTGEIIGEMAPIDNSPRSATVRAVRASKVAILNLESFYSLLLSDSVLAVEMLKRGTSRLRSTSQQMIEGLETKNAELLKAYQDLKAAQAELIHLNRIQEELAVARRIQKFFLPRTIPQPEGWQVAAFNRGAQEIGGDFFDCIELAGDRLGLVVADACGKGVPAAMFVALTRSLLRASSQAPWALSREENFLDLDSIVTGALWFTNDYAAREHGESNMFVTVFFGLLDPRNGQLFFVNAGHNPPLVIAPGGASVRELESTTLPVGIIEEQTYEALETTIEVGDMLVCFSDGVTEAMNKAGEPYGDERFVDLLREHADYDAADMVSLIVQSIDDYANGAPQADDITILVTKRLV
jgi:serine phosphatase RsbU (regulator of sigma subunit)